MKCECECEWGCILFVCVIYEGLRHEAASALLYQAELFLVREWMRERVGTRYSPIAVREWVAKHSLVAIRDELRIEISTASTPFGRGWTIATEQRVRERLPRGLRVWAPTPTLLALLALSASSAPLKTVPKSIYLVNFLDVRVRNFEHSCTRSCSSTIYLNRLIIASPHVRSLLIRPVPI